MVSILGFPYFGKLPYGGFLKLRVPIWEAGAAAQKKTFLMVSRGFGRGGREVRMVLVRLGEPRTQGPRLSGGGLGAAARENLVLDVKKVFKGDWRGVEGGEDGARGDRELD